MVFIRFIVVPTNRPCDQPTDQTVQESNAHTHNLPHTQATQQQKRRRMVPVVGGTMNRTTTYCAREPRKTLSTHKTKIDKTFASTQNHYNEKIVNKRKCLDGQQTHPVTTTKTYNTRHRINSVRTDHEVCEEATTKRTTENNVNKNQQCRQSV